MGSTSGELMRHPDRRLPNAPLHSLPHITKICHEINIKLSRLFQLYQKYGAIAGGGGPCETQLSLTGDHPTPRRMNTTLPDGDDIVIKNTFCSSLRPH